MKKFKNLEINLEALGIETYDHQNGRPSMVDINNVQMYEGEDINYFMQNQNQ